MADSRRPDDGSRRSPRDRGRDRVANAEGLVHRPVANESGLAALGAQIEQKGRRPIRRRNGKARWSRRRKLVTVLSSVVVLALLIAGVG